MGTGRLFESLGQGVPFLLAAAKPLRVGHLDWTFPKIVILPNRGSGGVEAGYDYILERGARCGVRGKILGGLCQIVRVINNWQSDDNSAIFRRTMRSERGKGQSGVRGAGCEVRFLGGLCQIVRVINNWQSDDNSANFAVQCDQSEVKDSTRTPKLPQ